MRNLRLTHRKSLHQRQKGNSFGHKWKWETIFMLKISRISRQFSFNIVSVWCGACATQRGEKNVHLIWRFRRWNRFNQRKLLAFCRREIVILNVYLIKTKSNVCVCVCVHDINLNHPKCSQRTPNKIASTATSHFVCILMNNSWKVIVFHFETIAYTRRQSPSFSQLVDCVHVCAIGDNKCSYEQWIWHLNRFGLIFVGYANRHAHISSSAFEVLIKERIIADVDQKVINIFCLMNDSTAQPNYYFKFASFFCSADERWKLIFVWKFNAMK